jgi:hypothetical protein
MKTTLRRFTVLVVSLAAATTLAQEAQLPSGNWQSTAHATYTNPALTGAELYLSIDVARDGRFQGEWGQYLCDSYPGAYGISIYSCRRTGSNRVSGKFGPDRGGVIDLEKLGRSAFTWAVPGADELALDLPKNWQGGDAILYRARLTRDGKGKPAAAAGSAVKDDKKIERSQGDSAATSSELLSANALYREFQDNPVDASDKYVDHAVVLRGRRGEMVLLPDGVGAAVHIADGGRPKALILSFPDRKQLKGLDRDAVFRFKCTVTKYDFGTVWMEGCSIEAGLGAAASEQITERPTIVGGLLSANALYRAFESNADDASAKYVGQAMVLEGLRGDVIRISDGVSAAVHISDRHISNALILSFPDRTQLAGIEPGAKFRFRCTIKQFEYLIVWMENCSIVSR